MREDTTRYNTALCSVESTANDGHSLGFIITQNAVSISNKSDSIDADADTMPSCTALIPH